MSGRLRNHWRMWSIGAVAVPVAAVLVVGQTLFAATPSVARATVHSVPPNKVGELDCNGYSPIQKSAASRKLLCTDIRGISGHYHRFYDNGHYIGHDEPSIRFLSNQPGSGNNVTFTETLPRDPAALPGNNHPRS
jgi:hypothetical protein